MIAGSRGNPVCPGTEWLRRLVAAVLVFGMVACFGEVHVPAGLVIIQGEPEGAVVLVDEVARARIVDGEALVPVRPGVRRVAVIAEGFVEERLDLTVRADDVLEVRVRLWPVLE